MIVAGKTTFRSCYADSNPLWKVLSKRGRDTWLCEIVNEPIEYNGQMIGSDWAGVQKAFLTKEIEGCIARDNAIGKMMSEHDQFYKSLKPGQTIHYQNGFDNWVRSMVVLEGNEHKLKATALVGKWGNHDLPRYSLDGSIYYPYYADKIRTGETFTPNYSNLFEAGCKPRNGIDPRTLQPLDLSVPALTPEKERQAALWRKVNAIRQASGSDNQDPQAIIDEVSVVMRRDYDTPSY